MCIFTACFLGAAKANVPSAAKFCAGEEKDCRPKWAQICRIFDQYVLPFLHRKTIVIVYAVNSDSAKRQHYLFYFPSLEKLNWKGFGLYLAFYVNA